MYCPYKPEELVPKDIEYFWPGAIAYGFPAYINGSTGLGKTNVFLKVMADASNGIFPPGIERGSLAEPIRTMVRINGCSRFRRKKKAILYYAQKT